MERCDNHVWETKDKERRGEKHQGEWVDSIITTVERGKLCVRRVRASYDSAYDLRYLPAFSTAPIHGNDIVVW